MPDQKLHTFRLAAPNFLTSLIARTYTLARQLSKKLAAAEKSKTELKTQVSILQPKCCDLEKKLEGAHEREMEMKEEIRRLLEEVRAC